VARSPASLRTIKEENVTLYDRVQSLLIDKFGIPEEDISAEATFEDLDLDSLDLVEFALAAEEDLGVRISDEEAEQLKTLGDAVALLEQKGATVT
jgi:acyl carrier protein